MKGQKDNPGRAVIKTGLGARGRKKKFTVPEMGLKKKRKKGGGGGGGGLEVGGALKKKGGNWG